MNREEKLKIEQDNARRLIFEAIEASWALSVKKGKHPLEEGCNCIACVNKRKALLFDQTKEWKYKL